MCVSQEFIILCNSSLKFFYYFSYCVLGFISTHTLYHCHLKVSKTSPGWPTNPGNPGRPWIFFAPRKMPWKTLELQPTPEKSCSSADFSRINFWPCSAATLCIPVTQRRRIYEVIGGGGGSSVPCVMWQAAPHSNNGYKISSKTQNERCIVTSRSIRDNHIFRKYSQKSPGKPLKFGRKFLENPGHEFHLTVGHPAKP